ncbi:Type 1 glutamine amidotransferase-like domain-containing protein [Williamsia phyllosphaerae]|uniref:Peptidase n=1 Tax=Williamsia phyllosphaerae TaxID=885042 RepID=A0ABQ1UUU8_9NOCA|nr:Type 1 glutamine amidotransferase-like domain-containing protein [Williamsia phyllosphaerae]GGF26038.1 hypothetical protein GCM10007298_22400 [Williamsia phyllosphaerae]
MRLYLSSMGVGDHPDRLVEVLGSGASVGVVLNAVDDRPDDETQMAWEVERDELEHLGLLPERLDLRSDTDVERLRTVDALWVRGGNTFVLRAAMARSGADDVIIRRILDSSLAYAGYSAGAAILCADLTLISEIDDPRAAGTDPLMTGLGILDRPLIPHVGTTAFEEGRLCTALHERLTAAGIAHHALRDGDALATVAGRLLPTPRRH